MRKLNKILLTFVCLFALCFGLKAVKAEDYPTVTFHWTGQLSSDSIKYGSNSYFVWDYYVNYPSNNTSRKAYCIDGTRDNDAQGDGIAVKEVYDFSKGNSSNLKYYGLYHILSNGAQLPYDSNSKEEIIATDIAVRAYSNVILSLAIGSDNKNSAILDFGIKVALKTPLKTAVVMDLADSCKKSDTEAEKCIKARFNNNSGLTLTGTTLSGDTSRAETLLSGAIDETYKLKMNINKPATYSVKGGESTKIKDEATGEYLTEMKEIEFKIENLPDGGYVNVTRNDIKCDKCGTDPNKDIVMTKVEYLENGTWKELGNTAVNLASMLDSKSVAKLRATISKPKKEGNTSCDAEIVVDYHVFDPRYKFYLVQYHDNDSAYTQRYFGVVPKDGNYITTPESDKTPDTLTSSPIRITAQCEPSTTEGECDTKIETPVCSDDNDGIASIKAPTNIKTCIIDKSDVAGNLYELTVNNGGIKNRYCSTYCKEDYAEIKLNRGVKDPMPKCGGYFQLKASIKGSQECYHASPDSADKSINKALFIEDIIKAQVNLAEARNLLIKATAAKNNIKDYTENGSIKYYFAQGNYTARVLASSNASTGRITWKDEVRPYDYNATTRDEVVKAIDADIEKATKDLSQDSTVYNDSTAYGQLIKIINNYNACTTSFDHTFKFDQKVYWGYSEEYDKLVSEDARDMAIVEDSQESSSKVEICTGTVNNEFTTCNGSTNWPTKDDASIYTQYTFDVCSASGCTATQFKVSNATFAKQTSTASAQYITPEVFYQVASSGPASGAITTNKNFREPNIQLTPVGGLPIALDAVGGGSFRLRVDGLGEFHDTGAAGRIIGYVAEGNKLDRKLNEHSVAYKLLQEGEGITVWDGDYQCHFYNECRPSDCPDCDYECEGPLCHWTPCPTCNFECVNCIYNLGKLQLTNKQISTTKFDSANREYGYNWNINTLTGDIVDQLKLIQDKAKATRDEIEASNEKIYDDSNPNGEDSELDFSITISSPAGINWILNYNKEAEKDGGYGNQTQECYDYEGVDKVVYPNQFCYSTFIDELEDVDGIQIVAKNRDEKGNRTESENSRILKKSSTYWEPWDKTHESLTEYRNKFGEDVIGGIASK